MKSIIVSMAVMVALMVAGGASAADLAELAKKNGCAGCHSADKQMVGPSWKAIGEKYKGDAKAASYLDGKIKQGSSGVWGKMPMPASSKISDADTKEIVKLILGQAK